MDRFTANVATTQEHPLGVWHLMENQVKIMDNMYIYLTNIDLDFQVNLEGSTGKDKTALTKPPHLTPTYTMPKTHTYDT